MIPQTAQAESLTICYFDAFSGISGDMTVGALVDAGAESAAVKQGLRSLNTGAIFSFEKTKRKGIGATKLRVSGGESKKHRHLPDILRMIESADLPDLVKQDASMVFRRLGEAEADVHQVPIEKVHFHEVGAVDSICDIVGACLALPLLGIDRVYSSAGCRGGNGRHGTRSAAGARSRHGPIALRTAGLL